VGLQTFQSLQYLLVKTVYLKLNLKLENHLLQIVLKKRKKTYLQFSLLEKMRILQRLKGLQAHYLNILKLINTETANNIYHFSISNHNVSSWLSVWITSKRILFAASTESYIKYTGTPENIKEIESLVSSWDYSEVTCKKKISDSIDYFSCLLDKSYFIS
jgi:hypothetical protein